MGGASRRGLTPALAVAVGLALVLTVVAVAEAGKRPYRNGVYEGTDRADTFVRGPQPVSFVVRRRKLKKFLHHPTLHCDGGPRGEYYEPVTNSDPYPDAARVHRSRKKGRFKLVESFLKVVADQEGHETRYQVRVKVKGTLRRRRAKGFYKQVDVADNGEVCSSGRVRWKAKRR